METIVDQPPRTDRTRRPFPSPGTSPRLVAAVVVIGALVVGACGAEETTLPARAAEGRDVAADAGCLGCHGREGQGGVGPAWSGLAGSDVTLDDGSMVTADEDYLHRAIVDPAAEIVSGYTLKMPENRLSDDEADAVVAYIMELE